MLLPGVCSIESHIVIDGDIDHLTIACNLLYDSLSWSIAGTNTQRRIRHTCTNQCKTVSSGRFYVCTTTSNVHLCTHAVCDQLMRTEDAMVCSLTGNTYELEEGVIFSYDNASKSGDEQSNNEQLMRQMEADAEAHYGVVIKDVPSTNHQRRRIQPGVKRQKLDVVLVPVHIPTIVFIAPIPAIVVESWAIVVPVARKKVKATSVETANINRHEVNSLAQTFLSKLGMPHGNDMYVIARACEYTWSYIQDTKLFNDNINKYRPRYHVAVMLRFTQQTGLAYGGRQFSAHTPSLSKYFTSPKVFGSEPYNVPSGKFTSCSTLLRKCIAEKAKHDVSVYRANRS